MANDEVTSVSKDVLRDILVSEKDLATRVSELVTKLKPFIRIDEQSGKIFFVESVKFSNTQKILLFSIGKFLAEKAGIINTSSFSIAEISKELNILTTTLSAPLGDLVKKGFIEKDNVKYRILYPKIDSILTTLIEANKGGKNGSNQ
jgi:DNA-binding MarR family transcriptional regulator